jgi:plastocyanin
MSTRWLRLVSPALVCAQLFAAAAPGATPAAADAPATVELKTFMFGPATLTIPAGTRVTWKNSDPEPHTIVSVDGKFRSGALDQGDSFTFKFDAPGTYRYVCSIHPQMVGTIIVKPAKR